MPWGAQDNVSLPHRALFWVPRRPSPPPMISFSALYLEWDAPHQFTIFITLHFTLPNLRRTAVAPRAFFGIYKVLMLWATGCGRDPTVSRSVSVRRFELIVVLTIIFRQIPLDGGLIDGKRKSFGTAGFGWVSPHLPWSSSQS